MKTICTSINQQIRANLLERGLSLTAWAYNNHLNTKTVYQILWRYSGKKKAPMRGIALSVINQLETETGIKICG